MPSEMTPERLQRLFRPDSVAMVGASNKSFWSQTAFRHLRDFGYLDRTFLVNPRSPEVHGRPTVPTIADIGHPVDVAFLMVPQATTEQALREAAAAGVRNAVVLSSGYGEAGPAGRAAQEALVATARRLDVAVLGPNHLGFANFVDGVPVTAIPFDNARRGHVALLSQSGASARGMMSFADRAAVGLSFVVTLGNEAMINVADVLDFLVDDESTRAVAAYLEEIRDPTAFERAARRALDAGKAVVVLKTGSSELGARTAAAHTGALVGDDRVTDAIFRRLGVIRVDSIEDMLVTAGLAAHVGRLERAGVGVVSISGGACNIIADRAADAGVALPEFHPSTIDALTELMPEYGTAQNPLDVTGAAVIDPSMFTSAIKAIGEDPAVGIVAVINPLPEGADALAQPGQERIDAIGEGMRSIGVPSIYANQVQMPVGGAAAYALEAAGVEWAMAGMSELVTALRGVTWWSQRHVNDTGGPPTVVVPDPARRRGAWSEWQVREMLVAAGIPVIPSALVHSADEAAAAVARMGGPVAVKVVSPDILHKTDIGGVALNVDGAPAVREAFTSVWAAGAGAGQVDGVTIAPMRSGGIELLVGVVRDPQWGPILAVGLGGIFVEVLQDSVLAPLPVGPAEAASMLSMLRGRALFDGVRGLPPADLGVLAEVIARVGALAQALGDDLESLEINPLHVRGARVEALDALVTWRQP